MLKAVIEGSISRRRSRRLSSLLLLSSKSGCLSKYIQIQNINMVLVLRLALVVSAALAAVAAQDKPNIIMVLIDDYGASAKRLRV